MSEPKMHKAQMSLSFPTSTDARDLGEVHLTVCDADHQGVVFQLRVDPIDFYKAVFKHQGHVPCSVLALGMENLGKKRVKKVEAIDLPPLSYDRHDRDLQLKAAVAPFETDGWVASFFGATFSYSGGNHLITFYRYEDNEDV